MQLVKKIGVGHVDSSSKFKQTFYGKIRENTTDFLTTLISREKSWKLFSWKNL